MSQSEIIPVELVAHDPGWAEMAAAEAARLKGALGDVLICVHHIGSTAISGIMAKPIIDLLPIVTDLHSLDAAENAVVALGYVWRGEFGLPTRRYCRMNDPVTGKRKFQLHCYAADSPHYARHVAFRDYLCAHPAVAKEYETEKIRAAALYPGNTLDYNAEKDSWIKRVERDALAWAASA